MAALVVGCVAVPDRNPVPLALEVPAAWSSEAYALTSAATKLSQWWMRFDDSAMNALVLAAQDAHTSVIAARAAVQQAIALREGAQANLSPKLNLSASAQRSRSGDGSPANNVQTGLNGDWAPDVSGAKQRAVDASTANVQAQEARLGGAQGSIRRGRGLELYCTEKCTGAACHCQGEAWPVSGILCRLPAGEIRRV
jgi:multidrug efflux system outer membrane protein